MRINSCFINDNKLYTYIQSRHIHEVSSHIDGKHTDHAIMHVTRGSVQPLAMFPIVPPICFGLNTTEVESYFQWHGAPPNRKSLEAVQLQGARIDRAP